MKKGDKTVNVLGHHRQGSDVQDHKRSGTTVKEYEKKDGTRVSSHHRPPSNVVGHKRADTDVRSNVRCASTNKMKVFEFELEATRKPMKSEKTKSKN